MKVFEIKISIVCPVYNKAAYLTQTIESVSNQTYQNWELILVDDGSTDGSIAIAEKYVNKRETGEIKFIRREEISVDRRGANVCRNIGLSIAAGDFIMFLDADDLLMPFCLKQRVKLIQSYPDFSLYVFNVAYCRGVDAQPFARLSPNSQTIRKFKKQSNKRIYFLKRFLKFDLPWHTSGPIWDTKFLQKKNGFNEGFERLQDPELHTRILLDSDTKVNYLMHKTPYDVLHRVDDGRIVWEPRVFLEKQYVSIINYIHLFEPIVNDVESRKSMQGLLLEMEKLIYRNRKGNINSEDEIWLKSKLTHFYELESVKKIVDGKYKVFKFFLGLFSHGTVGRSKLPTGLMRIYKKLI